MTETGEQTQIITPEYEAFVEKFKPKKTTDDCYTPALVYDAVADWVANEYGVDRAHFVRPFYPGGDYEHEEYKPGDIVVDNPPFSIMSSIVRFYCQRGIPFFLFANGLTLFTAHDQPVTYIPTQNTITYENGAKVSTSFITNMDKYRVRSAPTLYKAVEQADKVVQKVNKKQLKKHDYPVEVLTSSNVARFSKYGIDFAVRDDECVRISALDEQRQRGEAIFGGAYLIGAHAAAEKAAAEKWELSEIERQIVSRLA